jgi:hypothetical protein
MASSQRNHFGTFVRHARRALKIPFSPRAKRRAWACCGCAASAVLQKRLTSKFPRPSRFLKMVPGSSRSHNGICNTFCQGYLWERCELAVFQEFRVSASPCMADPSTLAEITQMPKRTRSDFFVAMVVSSFVLLQIFRTTPFPRTRLKTSAPASHLDGQRGRWRRSGAHSSRRSLRAGPDV